MMKELVTKCRSYRRFYENVAIRNEDLVDWVDHARLAANGANAQPLRFRLVNTPEECDELFSCLKWAGALADWDGPIPGERPAAYIVIATDLHIGKNKQWDEGIAAQTIMLSAVEKGFGGCMLASFDHTKVAQILGIDQTRYALSLVLALGQPKEEVRIVPVGADRSTKYYRDENQVHYVPKRDLKDLLL